ncbi:hypothetical protein [Bradyrhizobium sp. CCBAU 45389]|uniref:hypothetical protein n=1 Tax=Bradyrhizobium sp. CCBAU 45389 TaxID=858429 RepID=UPI002306212A|nr:hypothetical protein [Bradyrhizobium sp. CCBAU 45389]
MTVLPYTGQRRGDAVRLGPHSVVGGKFDLDNLNDSSIEVRQNKTGKELEIPLAAQQTFRGDKHQPCSRTDFRKLSIK